MPVVAVINPKGGVGKSTLATHIAGCFAVRGLRVMLGDVDKQQSSRWWLDHRPAGAAPIVPWEVEDGHRLKVPKGVTHVVLDTPAGLDGKALKEVLRIAAKVVVPLQASMFDIAATRHFLHGLLEYKKIGRLDVGLVAMRTREHTLSLQQLHAYCGGLPVPLAGILRDTQNYVHLAAQGLTVFDVAASRVQRDLDQWAPIMAWLDRPLPAHLAGAGADADALPVKDQEPPLS